MNVHKFGRYESHNINNEIVGERQAKDNAYNHNLKQTGGLL